MKKTNFVISTLLILTVYTFVFGQQHTESKADQTLRGSGRVNPSTLGMEIDIPLSAYPGRGISVPVGLSYSSKVWRMDFQGVQGLAGQSNRCVSVYQAKFGENSAAGWTTSMQEAYVEYTGFDNLFNGEGSALSDPCPYAAPPNNNNASYIRRIQIHLPSGESHELRMDDQPKIYDRSSNCSNPPAYCHANDPSIASNWTGWYTAVDSSNLKYFEDRANNVYYLLLPDGSRYDFSTTEETNQDFKTVRKAARFTDRNGNFITYHAPTTGYPNGYWTDTLGKPLGVPLPRTAPTVPGMTPYTLPGLGGGSNVLTYKFYWKKLKDTTAAESAITTTNFSQNLLYPGDWTAYPETSQGTQRTATDCLFHSGWTDWVVHGSSAPVFNPVLLTAVELPDGQKYRFSYNVYGEIERVYYPTGGEERFEYVEIPALTKEPQPPSSVKESNRGVVNRKVYIDSNDTTPAQWSYSATYEDPAGYKTDITNPEDGTRSQRFIHRGKPNSNWGYDNGLAGMAYEERFFSSAGNLLAQTLRHWEITAITVQSSATQAPWHPRVSWEKNITYEASGSGLASVTISDYEGDLTSANTNFRETPVLVRKSTAYDFETVSGGSSMIPAATPNPSPPPVPTPVPPTALRTSETIFLINDVNIPQAARDAYKNRNIVGLPTATRVKDAAGNTKALSEISYDEAGGDALIPVGTNAQWQDPNTTYRGNVTMTKSWTDITNNQSVQTHAQFDNFGNLRKAWDAKGNVSEVEYSSTYQYAYPTKSISPIPGTNGSATAFEKTTVYDPTTGLPTSTTDANNQTTQMSYLDPVSGIVDPLLRLRKVAAPNGHQTITEYGIPDSSGQFLAAQRFVKVKTQIDDVNWKQGYKWFDGLGRSVKSQSVDSQGDVFTETEYDKMGRAKKATNPYRTVETKRWTESFYDDLSRVTKIKTPDNAEVTTAYSLGTGTTIGTVVTVTDQASKQRRSVTNALGQLVRVDEPDNSNQLGAIEAPTQPTYYLYDTLNNLTTVKQGGTFAAPVQTRSFVYDSLSRLKSATNPESGLIQYQYDNNGNLTQKTDANSITTTYGYDALNRVISRDYSDSTPDVTYTYDNLTNAKGKLTKVTATRTATNAFSAATEYQAFDQMGRVTQSQQMIDGVAYGVPQTYTYNLSGALIEEKYPSTRVVKNVLDNNGDLSIVQSKKNTNSGYWNYAKSFSYTAAGAISSMQLGNGKWESTVFNFRLQPTQIALGTVQNGTDKLKLNYTYNTVTNSVNNADNNGNVLSQTITVPTETRNNTTYAAFTATQTYAYDALNRLKSATETIPNQTGWQQTFTYDRYGNRQFDEANTTTLPKTCGTSPNFTVCASDHKIYNPQAAASNNKFSTSDGYTYDNAGNTTKDAQSRKFTYDAENKQTKVETVDANGNPTATIGTYYYDGDGKRVKKETATETTIFVYNASGQLVAEYSTQTSSTPQVSYLTSDHLGSPRINTDQNGQVISRHDYQPFGEEIARTSYGADDVKQKFTLYERDNESELDFAQARMYANRLGRFTSVDPLMASAEAGNPQTWNRYTYALNNPLAFIDPDGQEPLKIGKFEELSDEQKRLFVTYAQHNYSKQIGDGDPNKFAENLFNQSADLANGVTKENGEGLLSQSQLTSFLGTTSLLESKGVIGELTSVTTINGAEAKGHEFRIQGELKNNDSSVKAIEKVFSNSIAGSDHGDYSISKRERGFFSQPNGQVTRIPNTGKVEVDVDYRRLSRFVDHNKVENSDISADDGKTSHYRRHTERYGPIRALTPINPVFRKGGK